MAKRPQRGLFHDLAYRLERVVDRAKRRPIGSLRRISVVPFLAHGTPEWMLVTGRVLASAPVPEPGGSEPVWRRVRRTLGRFMTHEVEGVTIRVSAGSAEGVGATDEEGYFGVELTGHGLSPRTGLQDIAIAADGISPETKLHIGLARTVIPPDEAERLIISDIDDTVLQTGATRTLRMAITTLTGSSWTRTSFAGAPELYAGLARTAVPHADNPFFYVSSSPWNLYEFLMAFIRRSGLPVGPLFLRDLGIDGTKFIKESHGIHKRSAIDHLLSTYELPVILVGDTGQKDPEIYRAIVDDYPGRVGAVLLRHVAGAARSEQVTDLYRGAATTVAISASSAELARSAEGVGLVPPGWAERVAEAEKRR